MNRKAYYHAQLVNLFPFNYTQTATDVLVIYHKGTGTTHSPHHGWLDGTQTISDYYGMAGRVNKTSESPKHTLQRGN